MDNSNSTDATNSVDTLPILIRRQVEAQIISPFVAALNERFDPDEVSEILEQTIVRHAREHGRRLATQVGGNTLEHFIQVLELWTRGGALEMDIIEQSPTRLCFNVTRCRYADYYRGCGQGELGRVLSCSRDFALIEGFNPDITLTRTRTILGGESHCDFRYTYERD
jgi:L-2-amino-thiazoline-4-carboxylic acid hydrolase